VSFIGAIILLVVGGPLWLIIAVVVAGLIILADTLYEYSQGRATLWDVGLAVLACIPITKGFTSMAAVGDAFRAGGLLGAGLHIASRPPRPQGHGRRHGHATEGRRGRIISVFGDGSRAADVATRRQTLGFLPHSGSDVYAHVPGYKSAKTISRQSRPTRRSGTSPETSRRSPRTPASTPSSRANERARLFDVHENVPVALGQDATGRFFPRCRPMPTSGTRTAGRGEPGRRHATAIPELGRPRGVESVLMRDGNALRFDRPGLDQRTDSQLGTPTAWAAHDAAPFAYAKVDPETGVPNYFKHWPTVLGIPRPTSESADDLSNIDELRPIHSGLPRP